MKKIILLATASLALVSCGKGTPPNTVEIAKRCIQYGYDTTDVCRNPVVRNEINTILTKTSTVDVGSGD